MGRSTNTVLFAAIDGPSPVTATLGDGVIERVVRAGDRVVRDAIDGHDGELISEAGGESIAAFRSARACIAAAVDIQRGVAALDPATPHGPLGVRIGVHAADVPSADADVGGEAVDAARRIAAAAALGEILISPVVRALVDTMAVECDARGDHDPGSLPVPGPLFAVRWADPVERSPASFDGDGSTVPGVSFRILGPLELRSRGTTLDPGPAKERALLLRLLLAAGRGVTTDQVVEALWGDTPPATWQSALRTYVAHLRRRLDPSGSDRQLLVTTKVGYSIAVDPDQVDASRFEALVASGRSALRNGRAETAGELLREALALWRGPALADVAYEGWAEAEAARLEHLRSDARVARIEADLAAGRHTETIAELEAIVEERPLDETLRCHLATALYRAGRQVDALEACRSARELLGEEFGLDAGGALDRLESAILRHDAELSPAVAAQERVQGNLPRRPTTFIGRDEELSRLAHLLAHAPLVTLAGPAGVGKTRLAVELADRVSASHPDGVWLCELAAVDTASSIVAHVESTLALPPAATAGTVDGLVDVLRTRRVLLVLDNCEHVLDDAAALADALVRRCPQVAILVTSRQPLAVDGEVIWRVEPLSADAPHAGPDGATMPDAVRLFAERAETPGLGRTPGELDVDQVRRICAHLDGLPLAIELTASRVQALGLVEVARRLDEGMPVAGAERRGGDPRHRTIRAAIDWSYRLLEPAEQDLFDRLSMFAGSFDPPTVTYITDVDSTEAAAFLDRLVDTSMITADPTDGRYWMLGTLRAYGRQRLVERGTHQQARSDHAAYFLMRARAFAAEEGGPDAGTHMTGLDRDLDDLRGAHRWATDTGELETSLALPVALTTYLHIHVVNEISSWAEGSLRLDGASGHPMRAAACAVAGLGAVQRGEFDDATRWARDGLDAEPEDRAAGLLTLCLGEVALYTGALDESVELMQQAAGRLGTAGHPYWEGVATFYGALAHCYDGEERQAEAAVHRLGRLASATRSTALRALTSYCRGEMLLDADPDGALPLFEEALALDRRSGHRRNAAATLVSLASLRARHGDPSTALRLFREAIPACGANRTMRWTTFRNLAELFARIGSDEAAAVVLAAAEASPSAAPTFGAQAERLAGLAQGLEERLGDRRYRAAKGRGSLLSDDDMIVFAREQIAHTQARQPS